MTKRYEMAENVGVKVSHINAKDSVDWVVALIVGKSMNSRCDIS